MKKEPKNIQPLKRVVIEFYKKYIIKHYHGLELKLSKINISAFIRKLNEEIETTEQIFNEELENWVNPAKIVILGESTQSAAGHIYNNERTFNNYFKPIKDIVEFDNQEELRQIGILNIDVYKYPLNSDFYEFDKQNSLYDKNYISSVLRSLKEKEIINENTVFIFRYKRVNRKTKEDINNILKSLFNNCLRILDEPLGYGNYSSRLNENIKEALKQILTPYA